MALKYNRDIKQIVHQIGSLVILYQKNTNKLQPRWRGLFVIHDYGSDRQLSYRLRQLNGRLIKGKFHDNYLRSFLPRSGYLASLEDILFLLSQQTIRARRKKTPRSVQVVN